MLESQVDAFPEVAKYAAGIVSAVRKECVKHKILPSVTQLLSTGDVMSHVMEWIPTGFPELDTIYGNGMPVGRVSEVFGPEACLDQGTFIQYEVRRKDGTRQNHKGGTIRRLCERFNRVPREGKGNYQRAVSEDAEFFAASMNSEGRIFQNRIEAVVDVGFKECFRIATRSGLSVVATADHKFFTGCKYVPLSALTVGDTVLIHNNTLYRKAEAEEAVARKYRKDLYVRNHGNAPVKVIAGRYVYYRVPCARAVVEAHMNGMSLSAYIDVLNSGDITSLKFLSQDLDVHHKDEDWTNDSFSNLAVLTPSEHARLHALERHNNLRFAAVPDQVVRIDPAGKRHVYDVRMESPFNNFVADGFVVHNSGKSAHMHLCIKGVQSVGGLAILNDYELALDPEKMDQLQIDPKRLVYNVPETIEQGLDVWRFYVELFEKKPPKFPVLFGWDSIAQSVARAELEEETADDAHVGVQARAMGRVFRAFMRRIAKNRIHMMFVNQERDKIGGFSKGGFKPLDTPGGRAAKYAASLRVRTTRVATLKEGTRAVGYLIQNTTQKAKLVPPHQRARWVLDFRLGPSPELTMFQTLLDAKRIKSAGGGDYVAKGIVPKSFTRLEWVDLLRGHADWRAVAAQAAVRATVDQVSIFNAPPDEPEFEDSEAAGSDAEE